MSIAMRRSLVFLFVTVATLAVVPGWTGDERLALPSMDAVIRSERVPLSTSDPTRTRVGALTYLGGIALSSHDRAFGGFSAMSVVGDAFTLLADGGTVLTFRMGQDLRPQGTRLFSLPAGPRTGWRKRDRDAESMTRDPGTGKVWVGFESVDEIWRYSPGLQRAEQQRESRAMRHWPSAGGIESLARLADGRFVALSEAAPPGQSARAGLVWRRDPARSEPGVAFRYSPGAGYDPSDITQLPDGRLIVVERAFGLPFRWYARLMLVNPARIRPGATVTGREIARLASPLISDNWEAVAATHEGGATILWLVSDDNQSALQRTLLTKWRLDDERPASPRRRGP